MSTLVELCAGSARILIGDAVTQLRTLDAGIARCCVTSPPYWGLRDYGAEGQIGLERTPDEYVARLVAVFAEVRRVLADDGTLWLNLGDSYAGSWGNQGRKEERGTQRPINGPMMQNLEPYPVKQSNTGKIPEGSGLKPKDLVGIPWLVAFALRADGWYLRSDIIWHKPNPMPSSVEDRPTLSHEYLFLLSKSPVYFYDHEAVKEAAVSTAPAGNGFAGRQGGSERVGPQQGGEGTAERWADVGGRRNRRSVWTIATQPYSGAHFATMPPALVEPCIKAGSAVGDLVIDPFFGAGTVGLVATRLQRRALGIEINPEYAAMAERRIFEDAPLLVETAAPTPPAHRQRSLFGAP